MIKRSLLCLAIFLVLSRPALSATLDGYTLTGIVHDPDRVSVAILEHQNGTFVVVREGETVELGKVSQIDRHSVIFDRPEERVSMSLEYGVERFAPGGARLLGGADSSATGAASVSASSRSSGVSTEFKPESRVVAVQGSAEALSALIEGAARGAGFSASSAGGAAGSSAVSGSGTGKSSGGGGSSAGATNTAPKELGLALAQVFDLPATMEVVRVDADPVESVNEAFNYIQSRIERGSTVTLFTHGIPPSSRIYIHPDAPGG